MIDVRPPMDSSTDFGDDPAVGTRALTSNAQVLLYTLYTVTHASSGELTHDTTTHGNSQHATSPLTAARLRDRHSEIWSRLT